MRGMGCWFLGGELEERRVIGSEVRRGTVFYNRDQQG